MLENQQVDICIIGAGLTGLLLAYRLEKTDKKVVIIESRERIGGRIYTDSKEGLAPVEMGATWLFDQHTQLRSLMKELELDTFAQVIDRQVIYEASDESPYIHAKLPDKQEVSYRIRGGTAQIINALRQKLERTKIYLNKQVVAIEDHGSFIQLTLSNTTGEQKLVAKTVISTLPSNLLVNTTRFEPRLPRSFTDVANRTHTWMGESIKIALRYDEPFWRKKGATGTIFSNVGPITEMYDHSDYDDQNYALMGFLNNSFHGLSKKERKALVLRQLKKYYGNEVFNLIDYIETVWSRDKSTYHEYVSHVVPHQNQGHPIYQQAQYNGKLWFAGTETSREFPGYMEGAVRSAGYVMKSLELAKSRIS